MNLNLSGRVVLVICKRSPKMADRYGEEDSHQIRSVPHVWHISRMTNLSHIIPKSLSSHINKQPRLSKEPVVCFCPLIAQHLIDDSRRKRQWRHLSSAVFRTWNFGSAWPKITWTALPHFPFCIFHSFPHVIQCCWCSCIHLACVVFIIVYTWRMNVNNA